MPLELSEQTAELLNEIQELLTHYIVFVDEHQPLATALWALNTWVFESFDVVPYLHVHSATPGCGKTHLLGCLAAIVKEPARMAGVSPKLLPRLIEKTAPTVLYDESSADTPELKAAIRGVLNAGSERGTPYWANVETKKTGKDAWEAVSFNVWCPKAFCGIGLATLADDTRTRCIPIELRQFLPGEEPPRFRALRVFGQMAGLRERLSAWTDAVRPVLDGVEPELPDGIDGRRADIWEPLFAIADVAGVGAKTRDAAVRLQRIDETDDASSLALTWCVQELFETDSDIVRTNVDDIDGRKITTADLLGKLTTRDDWPWVDVFNQYRSGDTGKLRVSGRQLTAMLRAYSQPDGDTIKPKDIRLGSRGGLKGYTGWQFSDVWRRWPRPVAWPGDATPTATLREIPPPTSSVASVASVASNREGALERKSDDVKPRNLTERMIAENRLKLFVCPGCGHERTVFVDVSHLSCYECHQHNYVQDYSFKLPESELAKAA
jgi:Protein of unknown function (DUF3631)